MTNYGQVFDEQYYRSVTDKAADYYLETAKSATLPLIQTDTPGQKQYVYVAMNESAGVYGGLNHRTGRAMTTMHQPTTYYLPVQDAHIQISNDDMEDYGPVLLANKKDSEIKQLVKSVDDASFHGVRNDMDVQLMEGIIGQVTTFQNPSSGADHDLTTKGEIWYAIDKMMKDIDFALREEGPDMKLYIDPLTFGNAKNPNRIYNDVVEWDFINRQFIGPEAEKGFKIGEVIITNKILALADDATTGNGTNTADTLGTDGRMMLLVPDERWIGRVVSEGFSLLGEKQEVFHVDQYFGTRQRTIVFNEEAVVYTERLAS